MPRETIQQYIVEVKWETVGKTAVLNDFVGVMAKLRTTIAEAKTAMQEFKKVQQYPTSEGVIKRVERMARAYKKIGGIRFANLRKLTESSAAIAAPPSKLLTGTFKMPELDQYAVGGSFGRGGTIKKLFGAGAGSIIGRAAVGEFGLAGELAVALGPVVLGVTASVAILRKLLKVTERYANATISQVTSSQVAGLGQMSFGVQALKKETGIDLSRDLGKWFAVSRRAPYDPTSRALATQMATNFRLHYQGQGRDVLGNYLFQSTRTGTFKPLDFLRLALKDVPQNRLYGALTAAQFSPIDAQRISQDPQGILKTLKAIEHSAPSAHQQQKMRSLQEQAVLADVAWKKAETNFMTHMMPLMIDIEKLLTALLNWLDADKQPLAGHWEKAGNHYDWKGGRMYSLPHSWKEFFALPKFMPLTGEGGPASKHVSSTHDQSSFAASPMALGGG